MLLLFIAVLFLAPSLALADITGPVRVIDGDTIEIAGERIRLYGIDAPELKQTCETSKGEEQRCGEMAKEALGRLVQGQDVACKGDKRDRYRRLLAICYVGPFNINEQMVLDGWAMAYRNRARPNEVIAATSKKVQCTLKTHPRPPTRCGRGCPRRASG